MLERGAIAMGEEGAEGSEDGAEARRAEEAWAADLVARTQAGDRRAFAALYSAYFDRVYVYLKLLLRDRHEAEDATQAVFVKVFEALPSYSARGTFWSWLFTIAKNHALSQLRKSGRLDVEDPDRLNRRRQAPPDERPTALDWVRDADIMLFIEHLPLPQRQVVALRYMLDLSNTEAAAVLAKTPRQVSLLHFRAMEFLRDRLTAIGRAPKQTDRSRSGRRFKEAPVLRARRFSL